MNKRLQHFNIPVFQSDLLEWYYLNKRDLPWRREKNPYKTWVSEIMLQQTKVDTVIPYFNRFMEKYPTVYDLAEADEQDVLKSWEGLGYYSRARNLQTAVREVVNTYHGKIPDNEKELASLKGVGPYTKGAILSIAFDHPVPAVDGNVLRVFSRILKIEDDIAKQSTKKEIEHHVGEIISHKDPSSFNQAIMDLGATICTPKKPTCMFCPVMEHCQAFQYGIQEQLPIKKKAKKQKIKQYIVLLIQNDQGEYVIEKRSDQGLLANLWQFPMVPLEEVSINQLEQWMYDKYGIELQIESDCGDLKHTFSHIIWKMNIKKASTSQHYLNKDSLTFVSKEDIDNYPFPVSHQKMMQFL
ncbi:A/G-specific adenine glycosylase [Oceanobacillus sp. 1P07AA]|uniref:A/G-specific adenine glycosylase n=1 Tax=Oceanobacillus sp. 1P07AA TaxID=3132293 RepID=UPI0039A7754B